MQFWVLGEMLGATVDTVCAKVASVLEQKNMTISVNLQLRFWRAAAVRSNQKCYQGSMLVLCEKYH